MPSIEVVIGLILIILFYSLLATIVMELLSNFMALRGKHLEKVLRNMLSSNDEKGTTFKQFLDNPLYQQLSGKFYGKNTPPSYLSSQSFRSILMKVLDSGGEGENLKAKIDELPDRELKKVLQQLMEDANFRFNNFNSKIESWYDDIMDRASGWYKRHIQKFLLIVGLAIAIIFNADTLAIYSSLVNSSEADLNNLVSLAEAIGSKENEGISPEINQEVYDLIETNLHEMKDPLSIGWSEFHPMGLGWEDWVFKVFGWFITALCISKGAPFWFDLLRKAVNIRDTGNIPLPASRGKELQSDDIREQRLDKSDSKIVG